MGILIIILSVLFNLTNCNKIKNLSYKEKELSKIERTEILGYILRNSSENIIKNIDKILENFNQLDERGRSLYHYSLMFCSIENIEIILSSIFQKEKDSTIDFNQLDAKGKHPLFIIMEERADKSSILTLFKYFGYYLSNRINFSAQYEGKNLYQFADKKYKELEKNNKLISRDIKEAELLEFYSTIRDKFCFFFTGEIINQYLNNKPHNSIENEIINSIKEKDINKLENLIKNNYEIAKQVEMEGFDLVYLATIIFDWPESLDIFNNFGLIDPSKKYMNGNNLLHWACSLTKVNLIKGLLKYGYKPNEYNNQNHTPLIILCDRNYEDEEEIAKVLEGVENLIKCGADPNYSPFDHIATPLSLSISNKNFKLTKLLLKLGATPKKVRSKIKNIDGNISYTRNPLEYAIYVAEEDPKFLEILLKEGAPTKFLRSSILLWESVQFTNIEKLNTIFKLLGDYNLKLNSRLVKELGTPSYMALSIPNRALRRKIISMLLNKGDNPNYVKDNKSLLIKAVEEEDFELCKILIEAGAKTYVAGAPYQPLHLAIERRYEQIFSLLFEHGADPRDLTIMGNSPLNLALRVFKSSTNNSIVNKLLEDPRVNLTFKSIRGTTPLSDSLVCDINIFKRIYELAPSNYIEFRKFKCPITHLVTSFGKNQHLKFLIERGHNPFEKNKHIGFYDTLPVEGEYKYLEKTLERHYIYEGERAIEVAIRTNNLTSFSIIMEVYKGRELEQLLEEFIRNNYIFGNKTLIVNIQKGYVGIVKTILKYPNFKNLLSSINYIDKEGNAALDYALEIKDIELEKLLKENGALISKAIKEKIKIEQKENSLINQIVKGNIDKFNELLEKDIYNLTIADEDNTTPLIACAKHNKELMLETAIKELYKIKKLNSNINRVDIYNKTALSYAIDNKNIKILNLLLENGANPNFRYARIYTYLIDLAFDTSEEANEIINILFKSKAQLNIKDLKFLIKNKKDLNKTLLKLFENEIKELESSTFLSKKPTKNVNIKQILIVNSCVKELNNLKPASLKKLKEELNRVKNGENLSDTRDLKGYSTKFGEIRINVNDDRIFYIKKGEYFIIIDIYIHKHQDSLSSKYYGYVHNKAKEYKFMADSNTEILKLNTKNFYDKSK